MSSRPTPAFTLTRMQCRAVDRLAVEEYAMPSIVLMENAAYGAADLIAQRFPAQPAGHILILSGGGNNGGDGLAVARHLHNRGLPVTIHLTVPPDRLTRDARINWDIIRAMKLPIAPSLDVAHCDLIVDAIFGTGLTREPRDPFPQLAAAVNASGKPVIALDLPSGLDADTGQPFGTCIRASQTITFVARKRGFDNPASVAWTGPVDVADIGCPLEAIARAAALPAD